MCKCCCTGYFFRIFAQCSIYFTLFQLFLHLLFFFLECLGWWWWCAIVYMCNTVLPYYLILNCLSITSIDSLTEICNRNHMVRRASHLCLDASMGTHARTNSHIAFRDAQIAISPLAVGSRKRVNKLKRDDQLLSYTHTHIRTRTWTSNTSMPLDHSDTHIYSI